MNLGNLIHRFVAPIVALGVVGVMLVMTPQTASAQGITVSTPFAFSVENQHYPAGTYQFTFESQWLLSVQNADGGKESFFPIRPEDSGPLGPLGRLTFHNCEGHKKLQAVYIPGKNMIAELVGPGNATNAIKTHGPRPSVNCLPEQGAVRERNAKGQ
jgi:hypothetical protein